MNLDTWILFCATETLLCFIPGPAVLLVVSTALTRGSRPGLLASLGILAANTMYFALSATGLGAVLLASREVFVVIKWIGAAYLVFLGVRMMVSRPALATDTAPTAATTAAARAFWSGFVTQAANPKALIFFTALLPQFIDPDESVAVQVGILAASSVVIEFVVLAIYVGACRAAQHWVRGPRLGSWLTRAAGALLVVAGARLAALRS